MIVEYRQPDESIKVFGYMMSDGPITAATGQMVRGLHHKCWHIARKREAKGDAVTGRVVAGTPTGYNIGQVALGKDDLDALGITMAEAEQRSTLQLSTRLHRLREIAELVGKGVGDPQVQEAFAADEHGGPYTHQHHHRLETYQLIAHLEYAHGLKDLKLLRNGNALQDQHAELHAQANLKVIQEDRIADGEPEPRTTDWRQQFAVDIE